MTESDIKVLGMWPSPFVLRARIALNLKSVDHEFLEEKYGTKSELLLKSNPVHKKIPVLIHKNRPICESLVIVQYINDVWSSATSILPADPYDRAIARFWVTYLDDKWHPLLAGKIGRGLEKKEEAAVVDQLVQGLLLLEEAFKSCSKGKGFFGGDHIGYLDIALGSFLGWIPAKEEMCGMKILDKEKTPLLAAWAERVRSDAAVKGLIPETDRLVEFGKMILAKIKAAKVAAAAAAPTS